MSRPSDPHWIVVSGVSGSGKSTVGTTLAQRLDLPFCDGDDLHPQANRDKMAAGHALDDDDRRPWLIEVGRWLASEPDGGVIACSALKRAYRDLIRSECSRAWVAHLSGEPKLIAARQAGRKGHFMPPSLMPSQFAALQPLDPDEPGAEIDVGPPVDDVVQGILAALEHSSKG